LEADPEVEFHNYAIKTAFTFSGLTVFWFPEAPLALCASSALGLISRAQISRGWAHGGDLRPCRWMTGFVAVYHGPKKQEREGK